jgi:hypothetical protein
MRTINGTFNSTDAALVVGERVREIVGPRATVRVFLPTTGQDVIETSIVADRSSWTRVLGMCLALGLAGVVLFAFCNVRSSYALLWLFWSAAGGVMLAAWLTGEAYPRHILHMNASRYQAESRAGNTVVTVIVRSSTAAGHVARLFEEAGGRVTTGFFHQADVQRPATA